MMTPQEVAASTFPKATLGGYNMAAVDVFLDKLTEDYTNLYKENAALKSKIKVLVDKMEEYHSMEDAMRSTLLTAQKMASSMIAEAEEKRASMLADAEADSLIRMKELAAEIAAEEQRLEAVRAEIDEKIAVEQERLATAQREMSAFINGARTLCNRQLALIDRLGELEILPAGFTPKEPEARAEISEEIPEVKLPEPVAVETAVEGDAPVDEETAASALAEVVEELGGDAATLMENMRSVIDSFAGDKSGETAEGELPPFEIGFENAESLFESDDDDEEEDDEPEEKSDDHYDNFAGENAEATRVINLNDLQFGRNYNKD